jgi:hypothetical protein
LTFVIPAAASLAGSISYTTVDVPGAFSTILIGISNDGVAVGTYTNSSGNTHGFERLADGTLIYPVDDPNGTTTIQGNPPTTITMTALHGINDSGTSAGVGRNETDSFTLNGNTSPRSVWAPELRSSAALMIRETWPASM